MPSALATTGRQTADLAKSKFGDKILEIQTCPSDVVLKVTVDAWRDVHAFLKADEFDLFISLSAVDWLKEGLMWVVSHLYDTKKKRRISVKAELPRVSPRIDSLASIWEGANWHERECWDLSGVAFDGHPNLRRILCPDDWEGHALRKDYKAPDYYHGIQNNVNLIDLDHRPPIPEIV